MPGIFVLVVGLFPLEHDIGQRLRGWVFPYPGLVSCVSTMIMRFSTKISTSFSQCEISSSYFPPTLAMRSHSQT